MKLTESAFFKRLLFITLSVFFIFSAITAETSGCSSVNAYFIKNSISKESSAFDFRRLTFAGSGEFFKLDPLTDSIIAGTGVTLLGTELALSKFSNIKDNVWDGTTFNKDGVPSFDRFFMQPFSKGLNITGDIFQYVGLLMPAVLMASPMEEWLTVGVMYAESVLVAYGVKELAKSIVSRARPYMYYDDKPIDLIQEGDWNESFPSGHSTLAFVGATFASYVFSKYFSDSPWKYVVTAASYSIATATAVFRVAGGKHFFTDVLTGAAIGTATGFLVPWLHSLRAEKNSAEALQASGASKEVEPLLYMGGFGIKISLR